MSNDGMKKKLEKKPLVIGFFAGAIGILCCISPVILVLLGLSTVTAAIAMGNNLFYNYKLYFIGASVIFLVIALALYLKQKKQCSISGVRKNLNLIILSVFIAILTYTFFYYFTTWLAIKFG